MSIIKKYSRYGDPRKFATAEARRDAALRSGARYAGNETPHGLTALETEQLNERLEAMLPQASSQYGHVNDVLSDILPSGANLDPNAGRGYRNALQQRTAAQGPQSSYGSGTMLTTQRPYAPEYEDPSRQQYPVHRCLVEGTLVQYASGRVGPVEDVAEGDLLLGPDGTARQVIESWSSGAPDRLLEVHWTNGRVVRCTADHLWPTTAGDKRADALCPDDTCFVARKFEADIATGVSAELARLAGYYAAEGSIVYNAADGAAVGVKFSLHLDETDLEADIRRCLLASFDAQKGASAATPLSRAEITAGRRIGRLSVISDRYKRGTNAVVDCLCDCGVERTYLLSTLVAGNTDSCGCRMGFRTDLDTAHTARYVYATCLRNRSADAAAKRAARWLIEHVGMGSDTKALAPTVMSWPMRLKREFLIGYLRGDGSKRLKSMQRHPTSVSREVSFSTASFQLGWQVCLIATQCGFVGRAHERPAFMDAQGVAHAPKIEWTISGEPAGALARLVWPNSAVATHVPAHVHDCTAFDDDFAYVRVRKVVEVANTGQKPVYDLTVTGDHKFCLAGGLVTHNSLANRYWRMFYKLDHVIGTGIDYMSQLPWGNFELTGDGVDGEPRAMMEHSAELCQLRAILPAATAEYFVTGESPIHMFWDDDLSMWTYVTLHNPDQLEVIDAPFIKMDPVVEFVPDQRLQDVLTHDNMMVRRLRDSMPQELISKLMSRQNIPLSPINFTLIARKLHMYDVRGTSIISRMWRFLMMEDASVNASIATLRRHAGPIKIAQLGNPATGWIPGPEHERRLLELLAQAELDPHAWITYHYGVKFDMIGTTERVKTLDKDYQMYERAKLIALGISQGMLVGEISYACFKHGTPVRRPDGTTTPIEQLRVGDAVVDKYGKTEAVEAAWCEGVPDELIELDLWGARQPLVATANHKWPVWAWPRHCGCGCGIDVKPGRIYAQWHSSNVPGGSRYKATTSIIVDGEKEKPRRVPSDYVPMQKLRSDELRVGDYLLIPRTFDAVDDGTSTRRARLLGYYVAEGDVGKSRDGTPKYARWSLNFDEYDTLAADIVALLQDEGLGTARRHRYAERSASKVVLQDAAARPFMQWLRDNGGEYSSTKRLSQAVMSWPIAQKQELVIGLLRGDGAQTLQRIGRGYDQFVVSYTTTSSQLASQVETLLAQLGYFATTHVSPPRVGKDGRRRKAKYQLFVYGGHARQLAALVWGATSIAPACEQPHRDRYRVDAEYIYVPIRAIRRVANTAPVYNLSVTGSHSYCADRIATYNSAATGLTVFLQRLRHLRQLFESQWLYPKFFRQMAEMNQWVKPTQAELKHRVRVKRSHRELAEAGRYIIPRIEWDHKLDASVDSDLINAVNTLENLGLTFSPSTKAALVHRTYEEECKQRVQDYETAQRIFKDYPELLTAATAAITGAGGGAGGMGGGDAAGGILPGIPGDQFGENLGAPADTPAEAAPAEPPPAGQPAAAAVGEAQPSGRPAPAEQPLHGWSRDDLSSLAALVEDGDMPDDDGPFDDIAHQPEVQAALATGDADDVWQAVEQCLIDADYPSRMILAAEDSLAARGILRRHANMRQAVGRVITNAKAKHPFDYFRDD